MYYQFYHAKILHSSRTLCKFCVDLRTHIEFCPVQHSVIDFIKQLESVYCEVLTGSLIYWITFGPLRVKIIAFERLVYYTFPNLYVKSSNIPSL